MKVFDCYKLYDIGREIQRLKEITAETTYAESTLRIYYAKASLVDLLEDKSLERSIKFMRSNLVKLLGVLEGIQKEWTEDNNQSAIGEATYFNLYHTIQEFEPVLLAEIRNWGTFMPTSAGAYDVKILIENEDQLISLPSFSKLFPNAVEDIRAGAKCLAFGLYTAAALHFHRANESVVLHYMDYLNAEPKKRNLGEYVKALEKVGAPEPIVSCLRDLAKLSRNPLMHPEDTIKTFDEADAVFCRVKAVIIAILKEFENG